MELLRLVSLNDVDGVKAMLAGGCDVNFCNERGRSALYVACERGFSELTGLLLEHGASATLEANPLIVASANGHEECARLLLTKRSNIINRRNREGQCSVQVARENQQWPIVGLLFDFGADMFQLDLLSSDFWKPTSPEHSSFILKLIKGGLKLPIRNECYLRYALKYGTESLAMLLLQDDIPEFVDSQKMMLHLGAQRNFCELIRHLIDCRKVSLNEKFESKTPLYVACMNGSASAAALLLQNGADPNARSNQALPYAIQIAARTGRKDIVELLLRNETTDRNRTPSPVHLSFDAGHMEIVKLLVNDGCNVDVPDNNGKTVLSKAAERCLCSAIEELVKFGADVNSKSRKQDTPLLLLLSGYAKIKSDMKISFSPSTGQSLIGSRSSLPDESEIINAVNVLVENGANCESVNADGDTPLYLACKADLVPAVDRLLKWGCDVNAGKGCRYPLLAACMNSNKEVVELLLAAGAAVNRQQENSPNPFVDLALHGSMLFARQWGQRPFGDSDVQTSPLSVCLKTGWPCIAELLIKHGADVNLKNRWGKRPIEVVMDCLQDEPEHQHEGYKKVMLLLLKSNAALKTEPETESLLHKACWAELFDIAEMLLEHGVDPNKKTWTSSGYSTPLRAACTKNNERLVQLLVSHGVRLVEPTDGDGVEDRTLLCTKFNSEPLLHISKDNARITAILLDLGADVNVVNSNNETALHLTSNPDVVRLLLQNGADSNIESKSKETPLYAACQRGHADKVTELLKSGADVNRNGVKNPLCAACERNKWEIVVLLLSHNAKCDVDEQSNSALCLACGNGNKVIVEELLKRGADVNAVDRNKNTPLIVAIERLSTLDVDRPDNETQAFFDIIDRLLSSGAATNATGDSGDTPLVIAVENALHSVVRKLIDHGADINLMGADHYPITAALNCLIIVEMCQFGSGKQSAEHRHHQRLLKIVELFKSRKVNLNVVSKHGESPLYFAICNEMYDTVEAMIDAGADANLTTSNRYPLVVACSRGLHDLAESLLDAGADPNVLDHDDKTPLSIALEKVDGDMVSLLLTRKANVNMANSDGNTPLHCLMRTKYDPCFRNHVGNLVNTLLMAGARVNETNSNGETPLYVACVEKSDDLFLIEMLLKRGADANIQLEPKGSASCSSGDGCNSKLPLFAAVAKGDQKLFKLLLSHGANINQVNEHGTSVVHATVENYLKTQPSRTGKSTTLASSLVVGTESLNAESMLRLAREAGADVNAVNKNGETALYKACEKNAKAVVRVLLEHGADVSRTTTENAKFPITAACRTNDFDLVELLLSKGSKANVSLAKTAAAGVGRNSYSSSSSSSCVPLCIAIRNGNHKLVEVLLSHGADLNQQDIGGDTALHVALARLAGHSDRNAASDKCLQLLLDNKADINVMNDGGTTPLYVACSSNLPKTVEKMLKYGHLVNHDTGSQPLVAACRNEDESLVALLLSHGADPNVGACTPGKKPFLDRKSTQLPLIMAAEVKNVNLVQCLLASGASAKAADGNGRTALHHVIAQHADPGESHMFKIRHSEEFWNRDAVIARLLLEAGAEPDLMDPEADFRPLQTMLTPIVDPCFIPYSGGTTAKFARLGIVEALIAHGAVMDDDDDKKAAKSLDLDDFIRIGKRECEWLMKLFKAGAPHDLLSEISSAVAGRNARCPLLGLAVVLNGFQPRLDDEWLIEMRQSNRSSVQRFFSWLDEDTKRPPSLMRHCRVVIRKQLYVASGSRTIVPLIGRLPLPPQLVQYIGFEGVHTEVDLTPASSSDKKEMEEESASDNDDDNDDDDDDDADDYYDSDDDHDDDDDFFDNYDEDDDDCGWFFDGGRDSSCSSPHLLCCNDYDSDY